MPDVVLASAAGAPALPEAPDAWECEGAALFADIAGYTPLTRDLARYGPRGAELVGDLLSACFSRAIEEVRAYGGDVLGFAGDAIIAFWHGESRGEVAALAKACADAIQSRPVPTPPFLPGEPLRMRIGVGVGRTWIMRLGGYRGAWIFMVAGEPLSQMGPATREAGIGEVMLSSQARAALNGPPRVPQRRSIDDAALDVDALRSFLPDMLLQRLAAGQSDWIAELRTVSVVFCTIPSMDFADRDQRARLQAFVQRAQQTAARMEGTTYQLTVDDKGCVLILAFGLPPLSHEDDAFRALCSARELDEALDHLGVRRGVGVATGSAYCGGCGPAGRRGYMVIGDAVNRAARLSQSGEPDVLCDQLTRDTVADRLHLEETAPRSVMVVEASRIFRLPGSQPSPLLVPRVRPRPPAFFVGRRDEVQSLRDRLRDFQNRANLGCAVLVNGRAGAGKTSLVTSVVGGLASRDVRVLGGAGTTVETSTAYQGWRTPISELLELGTLEDDARRERAVRKGLIDATGSDVFAPLLNGLLPIMFEENATTLQMSGQVRGRTTLGLLVRLLEHASTHSRLILVLDDVQWFDGSSLQLVSALHRARVPLVQILILRSDGELSLELTALRTELAAHTDTLQIELRAMPPEELRLLLAKSLGVESLAEDVLSMIASRAEGNPFFARELAYAMRESGALVVDGTRSWLASATAGRHEDFVPETVKSVVTQRLDHLSPEELMTLKVGSVLGSSFGELDIEAIYPLVEHRPNIRAHLQQLSALQFTTHATGSDAGGWTFAHAIIRDATYELITQSQRRRLHRDAALHLENTQNYVLLAHHWRAAGERDKQLACLEKAGDEAIARGANHDAVNFFGQALQLHDLAGDDNLRRAHWHGQLGEGCYGLGKLGESRYHLEEALRLLGTPLPRSRAGWALRGAREIAAQGALLFAGGRALRSGPRNEPRLREASRLMNVVSEQFYFSLDIQKMVVCLLSTVNLAERTGAAEIASRAYGTLGYAVGLGRLHALSRVYFNRARRGHDAGSHVNAAVGAALYHLAFGRWDACLAALHDGRARAESVGDMFGVGLCLNVLGDTHHLRGALRDATTAYEELVTNARARSNTQHEVWGLSGCAESLLSQGRIDEANERLRECAAVMPLVADRDRLSAFRHEGVKAAIRLRLDGVAAAAAALDESLRLYRAGPTPMYATYWAVAGVLETALALWLLQGGRGRPPIAVHEASSLMRRFARFFPVARSRQVLLLGHERWVAGEHQAALRHWRRAEMIGERLRLWHEVRLAKEALAQPSRVSAMLGVVSKHSPFDQKISY